MKIFVLSFFFIIPSFAQDKIPGHFFYELDYQGKKSYVLGTVHVGISLEQLPNAILEKHAQSRVAIGEYPEISERLELISILNNDSDITPYLVKQAQELYPNHRSTLTSEQFQAFSDFGLPSQLVPYMDVANCSYILMSPQFVFPKIVSMDLELMKRSADLNIPYRGLDNDFATYLIYAFAEHILKKPEPECKMMELIDNLDEIKSLMDKSVNNYISGEFSLDSDFTASARNIFWMRKLLPEIQKGNAFIFTGVGHLLEGRQLPLLEIFQQQGIQVKRVTF